MLQWFKKTHKDVAYLDIWRDAKINFDPNQPIDASWSVDAYEAPLGTDAQGELFDRAVWHLLRYHFYPPSVMRHTSSFAQENRKVRVGDRIVQRIRLIPGVLDVLTMNVVNALFYEHHRKGFSYITSENHVQTGEFTAIVTRRPNGDVVLMMHAVSKPGPRMPWFGLPFVRFYQQRAHRLGIAHFQAQLAKGADD